MWRNCGEIKRKLRYNERKRKGSGCEADIYFSCAINEQSRKAITAVIRVILIAAFFNTLDGRCILSMYTTVARKH